MASAPTKTISITNFTGRLTRIQNGDLNSGFAKFDTSFGYDPFTKPMNLTWLEQAQSIAGISSIVTGGIVVPTLSRVSNPDVGNKYVMCVTDQGKTFKILASTSSSVNGALFDSVIGVSSIQGQYRYGAYLEFFGQNPRLFIGADQGITAMGSFGSNGAFDENNPPPAAIGTSARFKIGPRPLAQFAGGLAFGNGPSIGMIDATQTIISSTFTVNSVFGAQYSQLFPALSSTDFVRDLDVSVDNNYLLINASSKYVLPVVGAFDPASSPINAINSPSSGRIYEWNGVDATVTQATTIPGGAANAIQTYLQTQALFMSDTFGTSVGDYSKKQVTLPYALPPAVNATDTTGNFLTWMNVEPAGNSMVASLYYFGSLDEENPAGLYRLLRFYSPITSEPSGIYSVPFYAVIDAAAKSYSYPFPSVLSYGKHYFSTQNVSQSSVFAEGKGQSFNKFFVPATGQYPPQLGIYETQTQLFSKRISLSQVRVYCEPAIVGNSFQLDLIGSDGSVIPEGSYTYTYGDIVDPQSNSAAVERVNFPGNFKTQFSLGVRITNLGTTNMTIRKVELDISEEGK